MFIIMIEKLMVIRSKRRRDEGEKGRCNISDTRDINRET